MQFDNLDKFKIKVDRTNILIRPTKDDGCDPVICYTNVLPAGRDGIPVINAHPMLRGLGDFVVRADSPRILWTLPPTGFFKMDAGNLARIIRRPMRAFKIGLNEDTAFVTDGVTGNPLSFVKAIESVGYQALILNQYPAFSEALESLRISEKPEGIPISRNTALIRNDFGIIYLRYNSENLCWFHKGTINMLSSVPEQLLASAVGLSFKALQKEVRNV